MLKLKMDREEEEKWRRGNCGGGEMVEEGWLRNDDGGGGNEAVGQAGSAWRV